MSSIIKSLVSNTYQQISSLRLRRSLQWSLLYASIVMLLLGMTSCRLQLDDVPEAPPSGLLDIQFSEEFDFDTSKKFTLNIHDSEVGARYDVFLYQMDLVDPLDYESLNQESYENESLENPNVHLLDRVHSGTVTSGPITVTGDLPRYANTLYLRKKTEAGFQGAFVPIEGPNLEFQAATAFVGKKPIGGRSRSGKSDNNFLIAVNGIAEIYLIDETTGDYELLEIMPRGTHCVAYDPSTNAIYAVSLDGPFELMRRFDLDNAEWTSVGRIGQGQGHRMTMGPDGLLYFSIRNRVITFDPETAKSIRNRRLKGVEDRDGGDMAFSPDGTLYLSTESGVYQLELKGNAYEASRLHEDDLPFVATGLAFDETGTLWMSDESSNANLITMDVETGDWAYQHGFRSPSGKPLGFTITDLAYGQWSSEQLGVPDTDGDGVNDNNDAYPEDPTAAYKQFVPGENSWITFMAEDLWPYYGDYDFNDTAIQYRFEKVLEQNEQINRLRIHYRVVNDGAGLTNGVGLAFRNLPVGSVSEVTGTSRYHNYIQSDNKGLEPGHDYGVVILTDDHGFDVSLEKTVDIAFSSAAEESWLDEESIDMFLIVNKDREREVHLPSNPTTALGNISFAESGPSKDSDGNFRSEKGLPWALKIYGNVQVPKEKTSIETAYNFFVSWALTDGEDFDDWYLDLNGHINKDRVK